MALATQSSTRLAPIVRRLRLNRDSLQINHVVWPLVLTYTVFSLSWYSSSLFQLLSIVAPFFFCESRATPQVAAAAGLAEGGDGKFSYSSLRYPTLFMCVGPNAFLNRMKRYSTGERVIKLFARSYGNMAIRKRPGVGTQSMHVSSVYSSEVFW